MSNPKNPTGLKGPKTPPSKTSDVGKKIEGPTFSTSKKNTTKDVKK